MKNKKIEKKLIDILSLINRHYTSVGDDEIMPMLSSFKGKASKKDIRFCIDSVKSRLDMIDKKLDKTNLEGLDIEEEVSNNFWDCNCKTFCIHPNSHGICPDCNTERDGQPKSEVMEILSGESLWEPGKVKREKQIKKKSK